MNSQTGFSISEVLISLFLASIIMTALTQLYLINKRHYLLTQNHLEEHFDLQWTKEQLSNSLRHAGFTPCIGIDQLKIIDRRDFSRGVKAIQILPKPQQSLQINRMNEQFAEVVEVQGTTKILIKNSLLFNDQRPLIIADCEHAEIQNILRVDKVYKGSLITLTKPLIFTYNQAYIGEWLEEHWFIKPNKKLTNSLYYQLFATEELTPLIHSLTVKSVQSQPKQVLEIVLGLDAGKNQKIIVAARNS